MPNAIFKCVFKSFKLTIEVNKANAAFYYNWNLLSRCLKEINLVMKQVHK